MLQIDGEFGGRFGCYGLLREYFPKQKPLDKVRAAEVKKVYDKINRRPRKRLGYRTPYEAHYGKSLHLI